jgi:toxin ParE1/3/4
MNRPYFSPSSRQDLADILEYISRDKLGAALEHVERIEEACWLLARQPELGTARDDLLPGLRVWPIVKHLVFYRPNEDGIEVVRILHGARDYGKLLE